MTARRIVALLALSMLFLSACGTPATSAPVGTEAAPTAEVPTAKPTEAVVNPPGEPVALEYWASWNEGEPQQQVLAQTIADFEAAQPNIKVNVTWAGRDVLTKVRTAMAGGTTPDLTDTAADELYGALIKSGLAYPLDDALQEMAYGEQVKWFDVFLPGILDPYKLDGKTYFIPYEVITSAFWYDQRLFDKYNVAPPKTWSDLLTACDVFNKNGVAPIGGDNDPWYNTYYAYWLFERVMGPGGFYKVAGDTTGVSWDDPAVLQVAKLTKELRDRGCFVKGYEGNVWPAGQVDWSLGKSAMLLCGSWIPNEVNQTATLGFKFRGFPFPEIEGGKGKATDVEAFLLGWVVFKDAEHPKEAIEFMKFAMQEKSQMGIVTTGQNMAARKGLPVPDVLPDMKTMFETATNVHKPYDGVQADYGEFWTLVFNPLYDKLFFGKISPEQFVTEAKAQAIAYWAKPHPTAQPIR